jgi:predicted Holliday junction resolvase-like endonuclease
MQGLDDTAEEVIRTLKTEGFYAECPCCDEPIRLSECDLFYLDDFTPMAKEAHSKLRDELEGRVRELVRLRRQISSRSEAGARAVNLGFIFERLAPSMAGFRFDRNDCRSLFDPIDYVIFEGLSSHGSVSRIIFSDIKTGQAGLQETQKEIRNLVDSRKVSMMTYDAEPERS